VFRAIPVSYVAIIGFQPRAAETHGVEGVMSLSGLTGPRGARSRFPLSDSNRRDPCRSTPEGRGWEMRASH
jgi:hypothetical protein